MAERVSAGLLMYRIRNHALEVLIAHSGGPYFRAKDEGYWTIPKGEPDRGEPLLRAALREFSEETGLSVGAGAALIDLGHVRQKGGKVVHAWAVEGAIEVSVLRCATMVRVEWPPRSKRVLEFPEIDRYLVAGVELAKRKLKAAQVPLVERLEQHLV